MSDKTLRFQPTGKTRFCTTCNAKKPTKISTTTVEFNCYVELCSQCGDWLIKWPKKTYDNYIR